MLQQEPTNDHLIKLKSDEPVSPYVLAKETLQMVSLFNKTLGVGYDHFKEILDKGIMDTDIRRIVEASSEVLILGDHVITSLNNISRNYYMMLRFLELKEEAYKEASTYNESEIPTKKRKTSESSEDIDMQD